MSVVGVIADVMGPKADMKSPMSAYSRFTSVIGGKADIVKCNYGKGFSTTAIS